MGVKKHILLILTVFSLALWSAGDIYVSGIRAETSNAEQAKPELVMQTGHNSTVSAVVFSPDNKWIASGSVDNTIKIWEAASGRELRVLNGHSGTVKSLAWSLDGRWLASGGNDKTVRLWNVETGQEIRPFTGQNEAVEAVAFSQNGQMIASGSADQTIKIWETTSGRELNNFSDSGVRITALAFSPDGLFLATGNSDNTIKIRELNKDKKTRILKNHTDRISVLGFSPDGQFLASGGFDNTVRIWKTSNGRELYKFAGHTDKVLALKFLSSNEIVSADIGYTVKFWNPAGGGETRSAVKETGADILIEAESAAFSSDGGWAVFGRGDRTAVLFETESGRRIENLENHISGFNSAAFSSDKNWLAVGSSDNTIKLWDLQTGQSLPPLAGHDGYVRCVLFHPDNRRIISASIDGTIKIWNFTTGGAPQTLGRHTGGIYSIAISRGGKWLVSGSADKTIKLWDLTAAKEIKTLTGHTGDVTSVAVSPDDNLIASGSTDKTVKIWNLSTQKEMQTLPGHTDTVQAVAFSPDGKLLASASSDKTVKIWDAVSGRNLSTLSGGHSGKITTISFSPDGQWLSSGSADKTIRLWRVSNGQAEKLLEGHSSAVGSANFSADGKWLVSAGEDGSVNIWQVNTADKLATLLSLSENNDWLVVSPNGFFDGSPTAWNQLLWRFAGNTFNFSPVEVFFNEFYQPGLLTDLLVGKQFDTTSDISKKDRRQPTLKISLADGKSPSGKISDRNIRIKIEVSETISGNEKGSGAQDVRLFRNGSLVKFWNGDVLAGQNGKTILDAIVPIVDGQNQFTAYAFNNDNIKSSDETIIINGAENLKRKGITYILAIGVGKYANPEFNLSYIESDVKVFGEILRLKQSEVNSGENIKVFPLLDEKATKGNILQTLKILAGTGGRASLPFQEQPEQVQPEDTVIVYFSGHGISLENRFYMIPHDLGYTGKRPDLFEADLKTLTAGWISDLELETAFRGVDAKNLLLIIDACNSGQALETEEKRQGPMNSKGLGQLAYEKGMYILTASQSEEEAYISKDLKQSYLTYALVEEGLKSAKADNNPADGQLLLREWFDYAGTRVPQIRQAAFDKEQAKGLTEVKVTKKETPPAVAANVGGSQRPRIFYRRQIERQPLIVARFSVAKQ